MTEFTVKLTTRAMADVEEACAWEKNVSQARADKRKGPPAASIESLRTMPARFPVAEKYSEGHRVVRRKIFGSPRGISMD